MTFQERARRIRLLLLDVDGVLSDGRIIYDDRGHELKVFDVQDGASIIFWHRAGRKSAIISARRSGVVDIRAKELGIRYVYQRALRKLEAFDTLRRRLRVAPEAICAMGDDLMDIPIFRRVGLAVSVPNGVLEARRAAHVVTRHAGGHGAVREVVERILRAQNMWPKILRRYQA